MISVTVSFCLKVHFAHLFASDRFKRLHFHSSNSIAVTHTSNNCDGSARDVEPVEREGTLHVKFTVLDGKVRLKEFLNEFSLL